MDWYQLGATGLVEWQLRWTPLQKRFIGEIAVSWLAATEGERQPTGPEALKGAR